MIAFLCYLSSHIEPQWLQEEQENSRQMKHSKNQKLAADVTSRKMFVFRGASWGGLGALVPWVTKGVPKNEEKGKERERKREGKEEKKEKR